MKRNNKKGFTVVELVIVIAVIAILAAVLIPTFASLIQKANTSADIQGCRQMNEYLAVNEITDGKTIDSAIKALAEGGMSAKNYKPLSTGCYYFWDSGANRVVYTSFNNTTKSYDIIYPEDFVKQGQWFSLNCEIAKQEYAAPTTSGEVTTVQIANGGQLAQLISDLKDIQNGKTGVIAGGNFITKPSPNPGDSPKNLVGKIIINLTEDIDFGGASFNINLMEAEFELNGNGHTISGIANTTGFTQSTNNSENQLATYGAGLIGYATQSKITFKNVTIKDSYFGNEAVKASAVFVGQANDCQITFENTNVNNCTVEGSKGVAAYVGHFRANGRQISTVTFTGNNNTVNDVNVIANDSSTNLVAYVIGRTTPAAVITVTGALNVSNVSLKSHGENISKTVYFVKGNASKIPAEAITAYDGTSVTISK